MSTQDRHRRFVTPEFLLVVIMLVVLVVLVWSVLWTQISPPAATTVAITAADAERNFVAILEYRKTILSILITAFGAWVGAGAAYFFGRENLREAAASLLAMRGESPREQLRRTRIRQMTPIPLDWTVKAADAIDAVVKKLKAEPARWFIPVVKNDGILETVIHEQAIWRFIVDKAPAPGAATVKDVIDYCKATQGLERDVNIHVPVSLDRSALEAYDQMQAAKVFLAIVLDDTAKPTHYITTAEVRTLVLQHSP